MEVDRRRVLARFAVAAGVVAALLYGVGWRRVVQNLASADTALFAYALAISLAGMAVNSEGFRVVLGLRARGTGASLARRANLAGMFVRSVLPAGNVGKGAFVAITVGQSEEVDVSEGVAGAASWEFLNMVASAVVASVGVVGIAIGGGDAGAAPVVLAAFTGVLVLAVVAGAEFARRRERVVDLVLWTSQVVRRTLGRAAPMLDERLTRERVRGTLDGFFESVTDLARDRRRLAVALVAAHLTWLFGALPLFFCLHAVGLPVSLYVVFLAMPLAGFSLAVPVPGGIGPMDAALGCLIAVLTGYPLGALASAVVLFRVATYGTHVVVGGLALWSLDRPLW